MNKFERFCDARESSRGTGRKCEKRRHGLNDLNKIYGDCGVQLISAQCYISVSPESLNVFLCFQGVYDCNIRNMGYSQKQLRSSI